MKNDAVNTEGLLGIIGGTGLSEWLQSVDSTEVHTDETPYGKASDKVRAFDLGGAACLFLPRHGSGHSVPPHKINYRANIWALKQCKPSAVVAINAVGGISEKMAPGTLVCPDQIIDYTYGREQTFFEGGEMGLHHVEFDWPYDHSVREQIISTAKSLNIELIESGVYGATQGPRLESAAEVRKLARDGCDVVGMTGMPECVLAKELNMPYASICINVNWGAGLSDEPITMESIKAVLNTAMGSVKALLSTLATRSSN